VDLGGLADRQDLVALDEDGAVLDGVRAVGGDESTSPDQRHHHVLPPSLD
jgi:hypothetical protein